MEFETKRNSLENTRSEKRILVTFNQKKLIRETLSFQLVAQQRCVASCDCLLPVLPPPRATHFHAAESRDLVYLVPKRIMAGLVGVFRNGGGPGTGESYIPVVLFDSLMNRSPCFPDADFPALTGNPVNHAVLFGRSTVSSGRNKFDLIGV